MKSKIKFLALSSIIYIASIAILLAAIPPATDMDIGDIVRSRNLAKDSYDIAIELNNSHNRPLTMPKRVCGTNYTVFPFYGKTLNFFDSCFGAVYFDETQDPVTGLTNNSLFVSFRGTMFKDEDLWLSDIAADLKFLKTPATPHNLNGQIHGGFSEVAGSCYVSFYDAMKRAFDHLGRKSHPLNTTIITITGHSLGAALSTIVGARFVHHNSSLPSTDPYKVSLAHGSNQIKIVKFSSPNIGDRNFHDHVVSLFSSSNILHFSCGYDTVSYVPPGFLEFEPVGITVKTLALERTIDRGSGHAFGVLKELAVKVPLIVITYMKSKKAALVMGGGLLIHGALKAHEVPPVETLIRAFSYFKEHKDSSFDMACSPPISNIERGPFKYLKALVC